MNRPLPTMLLTYPRMFLVGWWSAPFPSVGTLIAAGSPPEQVQVGELRVFSLE